MTGRLRVFSDESTVDVIRRFLRRFLRVPLLDSKVSAMGCGASSVSSPAPGRNIPIVVGSVVRDDNAPKKCGTVACPSFLHYISNNICVCDNEE